MLEDVSVDILVAPKEGLGAVFGTFLLLPFAILSWDAAHEAADTLKSKAAQKYLVHWIQTISHIEATRAQLGA